MTDDDVKQYMSSAIAEDALEMGFTPDQIEKTVRRRLGEIGNDLI